MQVHELLLASSPVLLNLAHGLGCYWGPLHSCGSRSGTSR